MRHVAVYRSNPSFLQDELEGMPSPERGLHAIDLGDGCGRWILYVQQRLPHAFSELALSDSSRRALELAGPLVGHARRARISSSTRPFSLQLPLLFSCPTSAGLFRFLLTTARLRLCDFLRALQVTSEQAREEREKAAVPNGRFDRLRCPQRCQRLDSAEYIINAFPYAEILTSDDN